MSSCSQMTCTVLPNLLEDKECQAWIARLEGDGFQQTGGDYPPSYRDNDRLILDDPALARQLFQRLRPHLPPTLERGSQRWFLKGLNSRFRSCRYRDGQAFTRHRDGAHAEGSCRSLLTLMLYLNDASQFEGGSTRFYRDRWSESVEREVPPRAGQGIVFDHALWHDGEAVTGGTKYVLRTDVMYEGPEEAGDEHTGYVFDLAELPGGRLASGSRDRTVRIWHQGRVEKVLHHHQASVTRLCAVAGQLWSGSRDREVAIWSPELTLLRTFPAHEGAVLAMLALRNGTVATSGADGKVRIWSDKGVLRQEWHCGRWPWALCQLSKGELLVGDDDGGVFVLQPGRSEPFASAPSGVLCLLEWEGMLLAGGADGRIHRWQRWGHRLSDWTAHRGPVCSLVRLPDGRVLSGSEDDGVRLWEADGSSRELLRHADFVRSLCVVDGGRRLASGSYDGSVRWTDLTG